MLYVNNLKKSLNSRAKVTEQFHDHRHILNWLFLDDINLNQRYPCSLFDYKYALNLKAVARKPLDGHTTNVLLLTDFFHMK